MPASPHRRIRFAAAFAAATVGAMALFFTLFEPWLPAGPERIPDGGFDAPESAGGWTGWNDLAQRAPDGGFNGSPGAILTVVSNRQGTLRFEVNDIEGVEAFRVSVRAAASDVRMGNQSWRLPRVVFFYRNAQGKGKYDTRHTVVGLRKDRGWKQYTGFFPVPPGMADARLYLQNLGTAGTLRVDDVSLLPVRPHPAAPWWKALFAALWFGAAGYSAAVLHLWTRPLGKAICATVLLILIGLLLPGKVLDGGIKLAGQTVETLAISLRPPPAVPDLPAVTSGRPAAPGPSAAKEERPPLFTGKEAMDHAHLVGHVVLFSLLALLAACSWFSGRPSFRLALAVFAGLTLFACATEALQFVTPDRSASLSDVRTDLVGMAIVVLLVFAAARLRAARAVNACNAPSVS